MNDAILEKCIIRTAFLRRDVKDKIIEMLEGDDFFEPKLKLVFESMISLNEANKEIDPMIIRNELLKIDKFKFIGEDYYADLLQANSIIDIDNAIDMLLTYSRKRHYMKLSHDIQKQVSENHDIEEIKTDIENKIDSINKQRKLKFDNLKQITKMHNFTNAFYCETGIKDLDNQLIGFFEKEFIVMGARPGKGKTSLSLKIALNIAEKHQDRFVLFFSLEMSKTTLMLKLALSKSSKSHDIKKVMAGLIDDDKKSDINNAKNKLNNENMIIIDDEFEINKISNFITSFHKKYKIAAVFIDYLQLVKYTGRKMNRYEQIGEITRTLKLLASSLNIPIISPVQLNRAVDTRPNEIPVLADLRESGNIEQDADVVLFLVQTAEMKAQNKLLINCAKNRNGATFLLEIYANNKTMDYNSLYRPAENKNFYECDKI